LDPAITAVLRLVSVAVPVPFLDALTYRVPDGMPVPAIGARVLVEVGSRSVTGCMIALAGEPVETSDLGAIKPLLDVIDAEPLIPASVVELCQWVAEYYLCGIGDAMSAAFPPGARQVTPGARGQRRTGFKTRRVAAITAHGVSALTGRMASVVADSPSPATDAEAGEGATTRLTARQLSALEVLQQAPLGLPLTALRDRGIAKDVVSRLAARGFVAIRAESEDRDPFAGAPVASESTAGTVRLLTSEQAEVLSELRALSDRRAFSVSMLRGVTGSGKTEIYLRLAEHVSRSGRRVLLMVPEIALTPAVAAQFRRLFGERVAIQHSALSDGERHDQWHRIRRGDVDVVVGTRSAVFVPLEDIGLIVVDEEHDGSYKQEETPRYHGRDVAVVRGQREHAVVVLGSATPSMETAQNAASGKYGRLLLERRVLDRPLASVRVVNMREEYAADGPDVIISRPLADAIDERLARREQVVVLLNRRGYATAVFCRQCGDTFECPNCSVSLTVHVDRRDAPVDRRPVGRGLSAPASSADHAGSGGTRPTNSPVPPVKGRARCHYCNFSMRIPTQCRKCAAPYLEQSGFGTEKVEEQLRERFPSARIGRIDRDSVRRKGALAATLSTFAAGELDVLVGTQMIAKGHDFSGVTLVGVISADVGLGMADFRAAERTFQLITQVAGRAGRGERTGDAIVQTLYPEHYSIQLAARQDYPAFFEKELQFRRSMLYPPIVAMVNVIIRGRTLEEALQVGGEIARRLAPAATTLNLRILGPAPAPFVRLRGEHRAQLFVKGTRRADMRNALRAVLAEMPDVRRRVTVDVDPLSVL
jgi:primosomal protein N' (replication factor Y)